MYGIDKILAKDNIKDLKDGKDSLREKEFDTWFKNLDKKLQNDYLYDLNLLDHDYHQTLQLQGINQKLEIKNMYSTILDEISEEYINKISDLEMGVFDIEELGVNPNSGEKITKDPLSPRMAEFYKKAKTKLGTYKQSLVNLQKWKSYPYVNKYYPIQNHEGIEIKGKANQYYIEDFYGNQSLCQIISKKSGKISKDGYTESYIIKYRGMNNKICEKEVYARKIVQYNSDLGFMTDQFGEMIDFYGDEKLESNTIIKEQEIKRLKNRSLSEVDFQKYFNTIVPLTQNVGDCYLVATLNSLRRHPQFEAIIANSITIQKNSNNKVENIKISLPLGSTKITETYTITQKDLEDNELLDGPLGFKALEICYLFYRAKQQKQDPHSGWIRKELNNDILESGTLEESIKGFFGGCISPNHTTLAATDYIAEHKSKDLSKDEDFTNYLSAKLYGLENINFGTSFVIAGIFNEYGSYGKYGAKIIEDTKGRERVLMTKHAYSIVSYDKKNQIVELQDPNERNTFFISARDLFVNFDGIQVAELSCKNIFK